LPVKATWAFPVWGNLITGAQGMACAFVCVACEQTIDITDVKYAVEFQQNGPVYHPLEWDGENCSLKKIDA
jgi:hypothetical protein